MADLSITKLIYQYLNFPFAMHISLVKQFYEGTMLFNRDQYGSYLQNLSGNDMP